ncbi:unnamed protein product [Acanthoscelides obtectus]|uniref:Uncharacterized protein n=1 Tax=Acanthoscelides obtectus TaxID=200917 RepID=A0A9P0LZC9_ACAOB|nr:unnamed protein product [Acanthoscelides obtectus]CAK1628370.1 hypothetical protein AOBTE_LOCUS5157 [Acanthoscelides obtectus]
MDMDMDYMSEVDLNERADVTLDIEDLPSLQNMDTLELYEPIRRIADEGRPPRGDIFILVPIRQFIWMVRVISDYLTHIAHIYRNRALEYDIEDNMTPPPYRPRRNNLPSWFGNEEIDIYDDDLTCCVSTKDECCDVFLLMVMVFLLAYISFVIVYFSLHSPWKCGSQ